MQIYPCPNNKNSLLAKVVLLLSSWNIFCMFSPYFTWHGGVWIYLYPTVVFSISFLLFLNQLDKNKIVLFLAVFLLLFYFNFREVIHSGNVNIFLFYLAQGCFLTLLFSSKKIDYVALWNIFINLFAAFALWGILIYFLRLFISIPFSYIEPLNSLKENNYIMFPGFVMYNGDHYMTIGRFCGVFDEPGVFGTLAAVLLAFDRFRNKKASFIILFASIFTFSLAFYLLGFFSLLFSSMSIKQKIQRLFLIALVIFFTLTTFELQRELQPFFNRFAFNEGKFVGDNRDQEEFKNVFYRFLYSEEDLFWGRGTQAAFRDGGAGGASIRMFLYDYGFIGFGIVFFVYFLIFLHTATRGNVVAFLIFFLSMYQRPWIYHWEFVFIFCMGSFYNLAKETCHCYEEKLN